RAPDAEEQPIPGHEALRLGREAGEAEGLSPHRLEASEPAEAVSGDGLVRGIGRPERGVLPPKARDHLAGAQVVETPPDARLERPEVRLLHDRVNLGGVHRGGQSNVTSCPVPGGVDGWWRMTGNPVVKSWVEEEGRLARIRLAAPQGNIIDREMVARLREALSPPPGSVAALLVDHEGPHFSYGASIPEHAPGEIEKALPAFHDV